MIKNLSNIKAFTLIEVLVAITISGMMAFFVYILVMYSYEGFSRLSSVSKDSNDLRFMISSLQTSMTYAEEAYVESTTKKFIFERHDIANANKKIKEEYYFLGDTSRVKSDGGKSLILSTTTVTFKPDRGLFFKDTYVDGVLKNKVLLANFIRNIFYSYSNDATNKLLRLNLGIIFDEVIDGKIQSDGSVTENSKGTTSFVPQSKVLCFTSRSKYVN